MSDILDFLFQLACDGFELTSDVKAPFAIIVGPATTIVIAEMCAQLEQSMGSEFEPLLELGEFFIR